MIYSLGSGLSHQMHRNNLHTGSGKLHILVTEEISNLQATYEENKDGCFKNTAEWIHPEGLGGSDCFIFSDINGTSTHTRTKPIS